MAKKNDVQKPGHVFLQRFCVHHLLDGPHDAIEFVQQYPTLWLVQLGRKRSVYTNEKAARAVAGKRGKVRAFVEVQA